MAADMVLVRMVDRAAQVAAEQDHLKLQQLLQEVPTTAAVAVEVIMSILQQALPVVQVLFLSVTPMLEANAVLVAQSRTWVDITSTLSIVLAHLQ